MDDPALAAVLDTYDKRFRHEKQRQYLFANALYINLFHLYRSGLDPEELYGHLRVFCQNPIFREYWEATKAQRASLNESSEEAGRAHGRRL